MRGVHCKYVHQVILFVTVHILFQAFKKMNKDQKRDQIDSLKSKYGIDLEKDKK